MMKSQLQKIFEDLKAKGLSREQENSIRRELDFEGEHIVDSKSGRATGDHNSLYTYNDLELLQRIDSLKSDYTTNLRSLDELLERDRRRQDDGFPPKIRVGKLIKPGQGKKDRVVIVPTTVEEKFLHDQVRIPEDDGEAGGAGEGEEGEVIGEQPLRPEEGEGSGPGEGEGGAHEIESTAYDLGKILTEKFELPNLKDKGKKRSLTRYTYDLTDKNRGFGQLLDKKATLRRILQTNIALGKVSPEEEIDSSSFLVSPTDKVYRILSREKDFESQAIVFFARDYSGSMDGKPTELVVSQHVMIYSWLVYQYARQVESRFILHDTEAREVEDFHTYYNSKVAGGTQVSSAYKLVNEIVSRENLARDYNIFIFHGTDGDDWDSEGIQSLPELETMLTYASRIGISIAENRYSKGKTTVEQYLEKSNLLTEKPDLLRLDVMDENADEPRLIKGIKHLIGH
jgi:hypothetical protein